MMNEEINQKILNELREQTKYYKRSILYTLIIVSFFLALIILTIYLTPYIQKQFKDKSEQAVPSWTEVNRAYDAGHLDTALDMAKQLSAKNPHDWYGYSYLGNLYNSIGDIKNAEKNLAKAYSLFPTKENQERLEAIKKVLTQK
jgi:cytochrome c-type biogenesis protein CcmH/NrfG